MEYTRFEKARMIGARALQISMGAPFMLKLSQDDLKRLRYSPLEIAKLEFEKGVVPITVKRPLPIPKSIKQESNKKDKGVKKMDEMDEFEYSGSDEEEEKDPDDEDNW